MKESMYYETFTEAFAYYDRTAMQEYFEQKALEGWQLCKKEMFSKWVFKRIEPKKLHYAITYLPQFSNEDSFLLSKNKKEYLEFCAEQGWQFACVYKNMVVFYNEEENPVPFETDPEVELAAIHKSMLKLCLPKSIIALVTSVAVVYALLFSDISANLSALVLAILLLIPLDTVAEFVSYLRWRKKALAAAATGEFTKSNTIDKFIVAVVIAVFVAAVAIVIIKSFINNAWSTLVYIALLSVYWVILHFIEKLKKRYNSGWKNFIIKFASVLIYIAVIVTVNFIKDML
ncbi:MAG: DUF2812 domain-containing protein [Clostridia bacterium]|nr:DUF2812 domain-containing protein [Clostridia bacterium]